MAERKVTSKMVELCIRLQKEFGLTYTQCQRYLEKKYGVQISRQRLSLRMTRHPAIR